MSVKRRDLVKYLEENAFHVVREGGNYTIYSNGIKIIPVKRHRQFDRVTLLMKSVNRQVWDLSSDPFHCWLCNYAFGMQNCRHNVILAIS